MCWGRRLEKNPPSAQSSAPGQAECQTALRHGGEASAIDLPGNARDFDRVARRWGVDYAIKRVEKGKYLLLFKAKQADAITGCFSEYSRRMLNRGKERRVPMREQLKRAQALAQQQPQQKREKEAAREDR